MLRSWCPCCRVSHCSDRLQAALRVAQRQVVSTGPVLDTHSRVGAQLLKHGRIRHAILITGDYPKGDVRMLRSHAVCAAHGG